MERRRGRKVTTSPGGVCTAFGSDLGCGKTGGDGASPLVVQREARCSSNALVVYVMPNMEDPR